MRVLGISPAHDSSIAIINDGEIEFFSKEERLSRIKRDKQPFLSLELAKQNSKGNIDAVVISSPRFQSYDQAILDMAQKIFKPNLVFQMSHLHHISHASLAFYNSGFDKASVIVIDRNGSPLNEIGCESETILTAEYPHNFLEIYKNYWLYEVGTEKDDLINKVFEIQKIEKPHCEFSYNSTLGITKVYETATTLIGQHVLENGKTMGLSAYGNDVKDFPELFSQFGNPIDSYFTHKDINGMPSSFFKPYLGKEISEVPLTNNNLYTNYAFQVQKQTQYQVSKLIKKSIDKTGIKKICITGGYALNVVANSYFIKNFPDVEFYFEPLADDSGNSIGAAMFIYREITKDTSVYKIKNTFFNGVKHDLSKVMKIAKKCSIEDVANMLNDQKSVAIYNGVAEAGPRALGNRSILFDARNKDAKKIVNKIKNREWYRPFAACVIEDHAKDYFDMIVDKNEYMTVSFDVKNEVLNKIPGVVHIDNTCRIQTVSDKDSHLYKLLESFKNLSGDPLLLNTSFNLAGQPLVDSPDEAVEVLINSELDAIWFPEISMILTKSSI